jgi:hypothetical protein
MQKFTGCKIFVATLNRQRPALGDETTVWLTEMRQRPGFTHCQHAPVSES